MLLIKESDELFSPLSVLFLNTYDSILDVEVYVSKNQEKIQAIVTNSEMFENKIPLGQSQNPELNTYADGVDTVQFLLSL